MTQWNAPVLDPSVGGEPRPSISELNGRLVVLVPHRIDESTVDTFSKVEPKPAKPTLYADVIVLDGGPLNYNAAPKASPPRPYPTHVVQVPAEFLNLTLQHPNIVNSCRGAVGRGIVQGIIEQGISSTPGNNAPWNLAKLAEGDPRRQIVQAYVQGKANGTARPNQPQPLNAAPQQPVPSPYLPQPQAVQNVQPQMTQPQFGQPQPMMPAAQGFAQAQQAPMQPQPQYGQPQAPWNPAAQQFAQPAQQAYQMPDDAPVPGFEAIWPTLTPEMKQQVRAQAGQQQQAPQGQPFNPYNQQ